VVRLPEEAGLGVGGQAADAEELMRKVRAHKSDAKTTRRDAGVLRFLDGPGE
jgi:20S proteasome alpha/beta subunit